MNTSLRMLCLSTLVLTLLGGCMGGGRFVISTPATPGTVAADDTHFRPVAGRDASVIAQMRAAPAPAQPDIVTGKDSSADQRELAQTGYVHVGSSYYLADDADAERDALAHARTLGTDRLVIYRQYQADQAGAADMQFLAMHYVRFALPFGATFRDLSARERSTLGVEGGVRLGTVVSDTPASRANLMAEDIVLAVDGKSISNRGDFQQILRTRAGTTVTLSLRRNDATLQRGVRLGVLPPGN